MKSVITNSILLLVLGLLLMVMVEAKGAKKDKDSTTPSFVISSFQFSSTSTTPDNKKEDGKKSKKDPNSSNLKSSSSLSSSCSASGGSAVLTGANVVTTSTTSAKTQNTGAAATFTWSFNPVMSEMAYTLDVQCFTCNPPSAQQSSSAVRGKKPKSAKGTTTTTSSSIGGSSVQFVDSAGLYCGKAGQEGILLATLSYNPYGGTTEASINSAALAAPAAACGTVANLSTMAGLYQAILNDDVYMEMKVATPPAFLTNDHIRAQLIQTDPNPTTNRGCTVASYASVLNPPNNAGDRGSFAQLEFAFTDFPVTMQYTTSAFDGQCPNCVFAFYKMGLYCGDAGDANGALLTDLVAFSQSGQTTSGTLTTPTASTSCGATGTINTIDTLKAAIAEGVVYFQVDTDPSGTTPVVNTIRGQVYFDT